MCCYLVGCTTTHIDLYVAVYTCTHNNLTRVLLCSPLRHIQRSAWAWLIYIYLCKYVFYYVSIRFHVFELCSALFCVRPGIAFAPFSFLFVSCTLAFDVFLFILSGLHLSRLLCSSPHSELEKRCAWRFNSITSTLDLLILACYRAVSLATVANQAI